MGSPASLEDQLSCAAPPPSCTSAASVPLGVARGSSKLEDESDVDSDTDDDDDHFPILHGSVAKGKGRAASSVECVAPKPKKAKPLSVSLPVQNEGTGMAGLETPGQPRPPSSSKRPMSSADAVVWALQPTGAGQSPNMPSCVDNLREVDLCAHARREVDNNPVFKALYCRMAAQELEMKKLQEQIVQLHQCLLNFAKGVASHSCNPGIVATLERPYNPMTEALPEPGPMDDSPRMMDPYEARLLHRQTFKTCEGTSSRAAGVKQIIETAQRRLCKPNESVLFDPPNWSHHKFLWKLWHYVFGEKNTLASVLTPHERAWHKKEASKLHPEEASAASAPYTQAAHRAHAHQQQHNVMHMHGVVQSEHHADAMADGRLAAGSSSDLASMVDSHPPAGQLRPIIPDSRSLSPSLQPKPAALDVDEDADFDGNLFGSEGSGSEAEGSEAEGSKE